MFLFIIFVTANTSECERSRVSNFRSGISEIKKSTICLRNNIVLLCLGCSDVSCVCCSESESTSLRIVQISVVTFDPCNAVSSTGDHQNQVSVIDHLCELHLNKSNIWSWAQTPELWIWFREQTVRNRSIKTRADRYSLPKHDPCGWRKVHVF